MDVRHEWVDMRSLYVEKAQAYTCAAAMGASFSAGSPFDNPSPFPLFPNGTTVASLNWHDNAASTLLSAFLGSLFHLVWSETNSEDYKKCQAEKPVLIPTGIAHLNWNGPSMSPQIMPLQVIKIGSLSVVAVPAEVTTMTGRRYKKAVLDELAPMGVKYSVESALANTYSSYHATRQEDAPASKNFGDLIQDVRDQYAQGEMVTVQFWGGHPNHNYRIQDSFLIIEALREGVYVPIAYDWDPQTSYRWERGQGASSKISISWDTLGAAPGQYRIRHRGDYKSKASGLLSAYEGVSNTFTITR
ncbi:MAG: neutral/alkaline non-lysosomal ceramidase C-terminal domain-containing protein [Proteobacteria bacterium]|nr:neutral/alkaline non-lysosomal ceramidase C-terminal domain-containing protein [Pseudomonadota bacterium]